MATCAMAKQTATRRSPVLRRWALCTCSLAVVAVAGVRAQLHPGDWPQFGRTPNFHSYNGVGNNGSHPEWQYNVGDRVVASPAVANGVVVTGSDNFNVYCFNAENGTVRWSFTTGGIVRSSPAIDVENNVYIGSYDNYIYKLDAHGNLVWKTATKASIYAPVTIDTDGMVYVGSYDYSLYAVHPGNGTIRWTFTGKGAMNSGVAIGEGPFSEYLVISSWDENFYCLNKTNGKLLWTYHNGARTESSGVMVHDIVYIGSWSRIFYALNLTTGALLWEVNMGGEIESHGAFFNGTVYASAEESRVLLALNATTGKQIWKYDGATKEINGSPSVSRDLVYVGANDGYLHVLDRATGELRFKFQVAATANVFASAAIADSQMVYISCNTETDEAPGNNVGVVYAINPALHL